MKKLIITFIILLSGMQLYAIKVSKKKIEFFVEHTTKNVTGVCNEIQMGNPNLQGSNGKYNLKSPFEIKIPILKISTGDSNRDSHMQEILGYPDTPFVQVKIESILPSKTNEQNYTIKGKLMIHGNTRDFSTDANVKVLESGEFQVDGVVVVKFSEFELENPSLLFMKAKDEIQVRYHFEFK
ncbi:YceI family protein [Leptospira levettii]|uniref:YceI family protein n=1 Tax=Leptospira levettii TaxID=2023178 RepID=UPI00223CA9A0|nr:YceI family protein [Leptospira levettii]MCW7507545.1 YceI family protein [Leptospira levettii]MCW7518635.1 YceI family protein [Leptospira levettii]